MKLSFFLIPLLLIGLVPFASAELSQVGDIESNLNYEKKVIDITEDGTLKIQLSTDGYIFTDTQNSLIMETRKGTVTLDKNTCGFSFHKNGYISENPTALFGDSIIPFNSISGSGTWNKVTQIINASCEAYKDDKSLVAKKYVSGIGLMEYKYIWHNGVWKTQLEVTNLTTLTNRVFGFDQTINLNRDTIKLGGVTRNIDNFNGTTFDHDWVITNEAKIIDLLNDYSFDLDLAIDYLDSITVLDSGVDSSKIVFHYRGTQIIMPNEKLIIDPTIEQNESDSQFTLANGNKVRVGEVASATSALLGLTIDDFSFFLGKNASPTGTATVVVRNAADSIVHTFGTLDVSTLSTVDAYVVFSTGSHTMSSGDRILIEYSGGDATNRVDVSYEQLSDPYDGTNTFLTSYVPSSYTDQTGMDLRFQLTYTVAPPPDAVDDLALDSVTDTTANLSFSAPNLNGETLQNYTLRLQTPQTSNVTLFNQNGTNLYFNATSLLPGTGYSAIASAATAGGYNFTDANILNFTTWEFPDGTLTLNIGNVGDAIAVNGTLTLTDGTLPITVDTIKLYQDNNLVKTISVSETIVSLPDTISLETLWYRIAVGGSHEYHLQVISTNGIGSNTTKSSTNSTLTREYDPSYLPAVDSPAIQGNVNATVSRFDGEDSILLKVNRISVSTGDTWQIECIAQTNSQAVQARNQSASLVGTWSNDTDTGYFNTTYTGFLNSHAYITCFNEDELFTLTDFTSSSLALLGIELFDESYGSMLGVPVGVFFLVMTAGMANKRTAPTWIIVIAGMAGTMATIGFFTFEPIVWGLALVTAMLGIFVNQKIF